MEIFPLEAGAACPRVAHADNIPLTHVAPLTAHARAPGDDPDSLDITNVVLTSAGAETRTCASAAAARDILEGWDPHVLISDIEMPDEDGYTFPRKVRASAAALAAGFNVHLSKPVDPAELSQGIANLGGTADVGWQTVVAVLPPR